MRSRVVGRRPRCRFHSASKTPCAGSQRLFPVSRIQYVVCAFFVQHHVDIRDHVAHKLTDHRIILDESRTCAIIVGMSRTGAASSEMTIVGKRFQIRFAAKRWSVENVKWRMFRGPRSVKCRPEQTVVKGISSRFDLQQQTIYEAAQDSMKSFAASVAMTPVSSSSRRPRVLRGQ
jgi:hypothetical protein